VDTSLLSLEQAMALLSPASLAERIAEANLATLAARRAGSASTCCSQPPSLTQALVTLALTGGVHEPERIAVRSSFADMEDLVRVHLPPVPV